MNQASKEKRNELKKVIQDLEQDPRVQEYLAKNKELKRLEMYFYSKKIPVDKVNRQDKEKIYIYSGAYIEFEMQSPQKVTDENYDYKSYISIESSYYRSEVHIKKEKTEEFEAKHIILYPPKGMLFEDFYKNVKTMYCKTLINYGLEEAKNAILNAFDSERRWKVANQRILARFMRKD